mgnify:FL=1
MQSHTKTYIDWIDFLYRVNISNPQPCYRSQVFQLLIIMKFLDHSLLGQVQMSNRFFFSEAGRRSLNGIGCVESELNYIKFARCLKFSGRSPV